jgi:aubergine-like protein
MNSQTEQEWITELKAKMNPGVTCVVLILPGQKGKAPLYDAIKKLLVTEIPVPSQVVLSSTISRGKNLRSIVSKILLQMNAKIGGEPWFVDNMPLIGEAPTMIMGMDVFHKQGKFSVLALVGTTNNHGTKYFSKCAVVKEGEDGTVQFGSMVEAALEAFKKKQGVYPARVIYYRDGMGDS